MTSATDRLRKLLDERGVEWWQKKRHTCWKVGKGQDVEMWRAWEAPDGSLTLKVDYIYHLTPEQAIAATLGRERTCHDVSVDSSTQFYCSECECTVDVPLLWGEINYCPRCGRKVDE